MAPKKKKGSIKEGKPAISQEALKKAFAIFDKDGDGFISMEELKNVLTRIGPNLTPLDDAKVEEVMKKLDVNKDGKLDIDELAKGYATLSKESSGLDASLEATATATAEEAAKNKVAMEKWDKFNKDGEFKKGQMGAIMKAEVDEWGRIWSDNEFPDFLKQQMEAMTGDSSRNAVATKEQFIAWWPSYEKWVADFKAEEEAKANAAKEAKAAKEKPVFEGHLWNCPLNKLDLAINTAFKAGKTPLLVDVTYDEGERDNGFSALETFYSYSSHCFVEMKKLIVQVTMKKEKTLEEAKIEVRNQLLASIKTGQYFVLLCSNGVPPFDKYFDSSPLPPEALDACALQGAMGKDIKDTPFGPMVEAEMKARGPKDNPPWGMILEVAESMRTVVVTKFEPETYEKFLTDGSGLPMDKMQAIKVVRNP